VPFIAYLRTIPQNKAVPVGTASLKAKKKKRAGVFFDYRRREGGAWLSRYKSRERSSHAETFGRQLGTALRMARSTISRCGTTASVLRQKKQAAPAYAAA